MNVQGRKIIFRYAIAIIIVTLSALLCGTFSNQENYHVVSFILLFVVSVLSTFLGVGEIIVAASLSSVLWNYYFIPPHHTFHIDKTEDILIFGLFFIIAFVTGVLNTRVRRQERLVRIREKRTNALFQLTKELTKARGINSVLSVAKMELENNFGIRPTFILKNRKELLPDETPTLMPTEFLSDTEYEIAEQVFKTFAPQEISKHKHETLFIFPLKGTSMQTGVLVFTLKNGNAPVESSFWDAFLVQISNALEREYLVELAQKVQLLDESGRLYKTLFNSISHEFRIPVATIMGASDAMLSSVDEKSMAHELSKEIFTASLRLNRLIENLLNMSRIESGHMSLRPDWYDINDLINKVLDDLEDELNLYQLTIKTDDALPLVKFDFGLMEQVLFNLLINATQYAPKGSEIKLNVSHESGFLYINICDQGPGFSKAQLTTLFEKFHRGNDSSPGGLGLGLSIAKGYIDAHNGSIFIENLSSGGANIQIQIPSELPDIKMIDEQ